MRSSLRCVPLAPRSRSRSRQSLWTKGETSGNFIRVHEVFADCDADALIYLSTPDGPSCHTGAETCFFTPVAARSGPAEEDAGDDEDTEAVVETGPPQQALTTLYALEQTILERKVALGEASEVCQAPQSGLPPHLTAANAFGGSRPDFRNGILENLKTR